MGITVIPALAGSNQTANAAAAGNGDGSAGDFAALLSGEIAGLTSLTPPPLMDPSAAVTPADDKGDAAGSGIDTALLASLFGQGTLHDAPRELNGGAGGLAADGRASVAKALAGQHKLEAQVDERSPGLGRGKGPELGSAADKPVAFSLAATVLARPAAANIAAESSPSDALPAVAAGVANPVAVTASASDVANPQRTGVNAHLHSAAWSQQFGDKVVWMAKNDQQSAQLTINPPQLGPIQITLNLSGDQASIAFASPHAEVRQAIESAMPQLKDMLSSAGINLGQSNVGANLSQQRQDNQLGDMNGTRSADENAILPANDKAANAAGNAILHRGRGLVDLFA